MSLAALRQIRHALSALSPQELRKQADRPVHILVVSDDGVTTMFDKDEQGNVTAVHVNYFEDSKSGTPGADTYLMRLALSMAEMRSTRISRSQNFSRCKAVAATGSPEVSAAI